MALVEWHLDNTDQAGVDINENAPENIGIELQSVRLYRLEQVRKEMANRDISALILSDPVNIRYTTGARNMQVFSARNTPSRYLIVTADKTILYEFTGCLHLANGLETIDEVRPAKTASFVAAGPHIVEQEKVWARETLSMITQLVGESKLKIGLERMNAGVAIELAALGVKVVDAQEPVEMARSIKSNEELKCVIASLQATERAVGILRENIRPGITENELWSIFHQQIIAQNGDYIETRLMNSGERTNPWFQESSHKIIGENELIGLDTDVVGCHGYYSDFSRTFHSGPDKPSQEQKTLYKTAYEQIQHNINILKPGMSFREYAEKAWNIPDEYHANRYYLSAHGCGMTGEYPYLYHHADFPDAGYDGIILPNMVVCVESYIGKKGGREGVKLEEQLLITEQGTELLSNYPFEEDLL
ncbi:Aminopeptidase YpdF (MP-, MA-, MS-, AP-, NP- specific) [Candidatus Syntrophocurvum alkaliphilum]|uniref:Aminopeptidase YpdF (MP-, MA-, MS-, AP-, NP-specific) n=1 Tax=Candidatus Syntrophocurvum alkaliphilum TaxID=2293317 RepID=A0A6I6DH60_9FIRM|nr:Xaa-Pro peptidase family protein [Candidatus Syntrophocurvum alkaliphilum]QGU00300.1 Aminopeptidase YpdF (MP-, MA-, MS-, AP-, NP- specific) [Candidatus Syntrophocurvum alkaliphilum]